MIFCTQKGTNKQTTIYSYHKFLKAYINEAIRFGYVERSPYIGLKFERGHATTNRFITEFELEKIKQIQLFSLKLESVRDLFLFQCYTGLAYADMQAVSINNIEIINNCKVIKIHRIKTEIESVIYVLPEVEAILNKYDGSLPKISNQKYNDYLKVLFAYAGIAKNVSSHWGRRTCGMLLLNRGVLIEVVAKVLGHSSTKTTEQSYAKILDKSVVSEVKDAFKL